MSNVVRRVLVFFLGLPLLAASIFALPAFNHPFFLLIVVAASALSAWELRDFFAPDTTNYPGSGLVVTTLGALPPLIAVIVVLFDLPVILLSALYTLILTTVMTAQVFRREPARFNRINSTVTAHLFIALYPGLLTAHVVFLTRVPRSSLVLLIFLLSVYLNDTMAYVSGMLLGKRSRPFLRISPNKTRVGFAGGFLASVLVMVVAAFVKPALLPGALWKALLFGSLIGVVTIAGDLAESALKRSAEIKDSGSLIPGRGGLLDSIDSPLFVAPFFYYAYHLFYLL
ncbi:MAG: phosphatidate cytidylyltransferase [Spirochaetaceae bacterium]